MADTTNSALASRERYLTRREGVEFIRQELGIPIAFSTAEKLAALGEFAEPAVWWGRRPLYTRDGLREWVVNRARPRRERTVAPARSQIQNPDDAPLCDSGTGAACNDARGKKMHNLAAAQCQTTAA
jgi:hypothetical protein